MDLSNCSISELVSLYSQSIKELKKRGVLRTKNVVGELGEYLVLEQYDRNPELPNLSVVPVGTKNINAVSQEGERYSIKSTTSNITGAIYGLEPPNSTVIDKPLFEYMVICKLDSDCSLEGIYQLSWDSFLKRVIILGLRKEIYGDQSPILIKKFYEEILPSYKLEKKKTLRDAIGDLPGLYPAEKVVIYDGRKTAHTIASTVVKNHISRYHNQRDIQLFSMLAADIESGANQYLAIEARKALYTQHTGKTSNIHKYNVLKWNEPSTTIPAHLCKDGLRHIHPDSRQARTITVREAARIQTFPDDYEFIGAMTDQYKMIGNAVPPEFARRLALAVHQLIFED